MKIVSSILTQNPCYTAGSKIAVKGLMLHSVGTPQPKASVFVNNWNRSSFDSACVHAFIDGNDGTIYQTLPWNHRGWHAGGAAHNTHIGVEMCEPSTIRYTGGATFTCSNLTDAKAVATRTYNSAVELFAYLCKMYGLNPLADGVIVSHKEGCARGIASNHGDPEHLWNQLGLGYTMNTFRQAVKKAMDGSSTTVSSGNSNTGSTSSIKIGDKVRVTGTNYATGQVIPSWVKQKTYTVQEVSGNKALLKEIISWVYMKDLALQSSTSSSSTFQSYLVKVTADVLNVRKGPGTNYGVSTTIKYNEVYTIVDKNGDWGKLKSGAGWIHLGYTKKI